MTVDLGGIDYVFLGDDQANKSLSTLIFSWNFR